MTTRLDVVVPAHDEAERIAACLEALSTAVTLLHRTRPGTRAHVTVVLDGCTDDTPALVHAAARGGSATWLDALRTDHVGVGRARALGTAHALARTGAEDAAADRHWLAHTDADSRVPTGWLVQHVDALADGAHLLVGAVVPDPVDLDPVVFARWQATHPPGAALGHVHGANLGIRADAYRTVCGFDPVREHEDVRLVARARTLGLRVDATTVLPVVTSGRFDGRTPGGYAEHLRRTYGDAS
ncbi:glycosyltransferase family 2 protein [Curtobacterium sp. MCBD17_032]|uniref:glycosyltransferase n=1 Tax=Curtobacterium sp. MCBD17_032 TaxID=2175659 RepID=UPI000DA85D56|nr:glycosyltransferase [Curtobacterium sp. MCBD17_032]PZE85070.1 glycosyl transferase [Curtobacterium sp. MCBD17_032]